jgi:hypothetical protein
MPSLRALKRRPNPMDVLRGALMSALGDVELTSTLLDVTSMSFTMRTRIYEMARSRTSSKVTVSFGTGRL